MPVIVFRVTGGTSTPFVFESEEVANDWAVKVDEIVNDFTALSERIGGNNPVEFLSLAFGWLSKVERLWRQFGKINVPDDIRNVVNGMQASAGLPQTSWEE